MEIRVLRLRSLDSNNPNLKGLVDLKIGELQVADFRIVDEMEKSLAFPLMEFVHAIGSVENKSTEGVTS